MTSAQLLDKALQDIDSASIQSWVLKQREIWEKIAALYLNAESYKDKKLPDPETQAILLQRDILFTAIG